jgi:hypothetical protein
MSERFTAPEVNLMCIYGSENRASLIQALTEAITDFEDEEMFDIAQSALNKVSKLADAEFAALELVPEYEDYEETEE